MWVDLKPRMRPREHEIVLAAWRERIIAHIVERAFEENISRVDVTCPPREEWEGLRWPDPDDLLLHCSAGHLAAAECLEHEFAAVQEWLLASAVPSQRVSDG